MFKKKDKVEETDTPQSPEQPTEGRLHRRRNVKTLTKKQKLFLALGFLIVISLVVGGIFLHYHFQIKNIQVIVLQKNKTLYGLEGLKKRNILFLNTDEEAKTIMILNPQIKTIVIEKFYPDSLNIRFDSYEPIAALKTGEGFFILSEDGKILEKNREEKPPYPVITFYQKLPHREYQSGQYITFKEIQYALFFLQKGRNLGLQVNSIDITGFYMLGLYAEDQTFLFSVEKDKDTQSYQFDTIVKKLKREGKDFKTLDLRFEKPVVTF